MIHIAAFVIALFHFHDVIEHHWLPFRIEVTEPHHALFLVVFPLNADDATAVWSDLAGQIIICLSDDIARIVEYTVDAAVIVLVQRRLAIHTQPAL